MAMKRLVVLPCLVLAAVVAVPFVMGNYPLKWQDIQSRTRALNRRGTE